MKKSAFLLLSVVVFFVACTKDKPDKGAGNHSAPVITVLETSVPVSSAEVCGEMFDNVLQLTSGIPLTLKIQFKSPNALSQYKIDIHSNFDCHGHDKPLSEWTYMHVGDLSGKEQTVVEEIPLPPDAAAGNYHCVINLIDELGGEADFVEFNLVVNSIQDSIAPIIQYTLPESDSIAVLKGDVITFKGTVTDNLSLKDGKLEISYVDADNHHYNAINEIFPGEDLTLMQFDRSYVIPAYIATGTAVFSLKAYDKYNNTSERKILVHVQD